MKIYIISREQIEEENSKDPILDEMIKSLVEYETRMRNQETEAKVLAQKVKNAKKSDKGKDKSEENKGRGKKEQRKRK